MTRFFLLLSCGVAAAFTTSTLRVTQDPGSSLAGALATLADAQATVLGSLDSQVTEPCNAALSSLQSVSTGLREEVQHFGAEVNVLAAEAAQLSIEAAQTLADLFQERQGLNQATTVARKELGTKRTEIDENTATVAAIEKVLELFRQEQTVDNLALIHLAQRSAKDKETGSGKQTARAFQRILALLSTHASTPVDEIVGILTHMKENLAGRSSAAIEDVARIQGQFQTVAAAYSTRVQSLSSLSLDTNLAQRTTSTGLTGARSRRDALAATTNAVDSAVAQFVTLCTGSTEVRSSTAKNFVEASVALTAASEAAGTPGALVSIHQKHLRRYVPSKSAMLSARTRLKLGNAEVHGLRTSHQIQGNAQSARLLQAATAVEAIEEQHKSAKSLAKLATLLRAEATSTSEYAVRDARNLLLAVRSHLGQTPESCEADMESSAAIVRDARLALKKARDDEASLSSQASVASELLAQVDEVKQKVSTHRETLLAMAQVVEDTLEPGVQVAVGGVSQTLSSAKTTAAGNQVFATKLNTAEGQVTQLVTQSRLPQLKAQLATTAASLASGALASLAELVAKLQMDGDQAQAGAGEAAEAVATATAAWEAAEEARNGVVSRCTRSVALIARKGVANDAARETDVVQQGVSAALTVLDGDGQ